MLRPHFADLSIDARRLMALPDKRLVFLRHHGVLVAHYWMLSSVWRALTVLHTIERKHGTGMERPVQELALVGLL